jgi:hypothetical protein
VRVPASRLALLVVLTAFHYRANAAPLGDEAIGTVAALLGSASVELADNAGAAPLSLHDTVREGETVRTGPGTRLRLGLRDGSTLTLGENAELRLDHLALRTRADERPSVFTQLRGYLRAAVAALRPNAQFEIQSPSMVAAVRGTDWIQRTDAATTEIFVAQGQVQASGTGDRAGDRVLLQAGDGVSFVANAPHTPVVRWGQQKIDMFVAATRMP